MSQRGDIVRFYAVDGAVTKNGGTVIARRSTMKNNGQCIALEGDVVVYPGGSRASVLRDESTLMQCDIDGVRYTVAAEGTPISNGDVIMLAGQQELVVMMSKD